MQVHAGRLHRSFGLRRLALEFSRNRELTRLSVSALSGQRDVRLPSKDFRERQSLALPTRARGQGNCESLGSGKVSGWEEHGEPSFSG